ncbi:MAG: acyl-CoA dehydrogenase family protein [Dehalococcoidia bacterium]
MPDLEVRAELMTRARALVPLLRDSADEIDEARQLPPHIVAEMKEAGVFRMSMPKAWGGWEADPVTQNLVIEELSAANGSAGWCVMIGVSGGFLSSLLDQDVARAMFPDPNMTSANAFVPPGKAVRVEGGYRVSGRWPFASGITHATWVQATAMLEPIAGEAADPFPRFFFMPVTDVEIIDTWHTTGLKGTGSRDFAMDDVFVPDERVVDHIRGPWRRPGPLYGSLTPVLLNHFGVPLGLGKRAIESYTEMMRDKPGKFGIASRDEPYIQIALAEASAILGAARAYAFDVLERVWAALESGAQLTDSERVEWRVANAFVHDSCARAVELLQHAAGSKSVYLPSDLDRCFRDIHTARQHGIVAGRVYDQAGRTMLGGPLPRGW